MMTELTTNKVTSTMTMAQFIEECSNRGIDTDIALENENICLYLKTRQADLVIATLDTEF